MAKSSNSRLPLVVFSFKREVINHFHLIPEQISRKVLELLDSVNIPLHSFNDIIIEDGCAILCTNYGDYKLRKDLMKSTGLSNFQKIKPNAYPTDPEKLPGLDQYEMYPEE